MTTLDDKLLGEKAENYCSSSSDDDDEPTSSGSNDKGSSGASANKIDINSTARWNGYSQNTGPKGVIRDWQLYKEHEKAVRGSQEAELVAEIKRTTITCKAYSDEVAGQQQNNDVSIDQLLDDELLQEFVQKRMDKLSEQSRVRAPHAGALHEIRNGDEFLQIVDGSDKRVTVVVHIYENGSRACETMNECLRGLAKDHDTVQFCSATVASVGVSKLFRNKGVPALLVYRGGELIGNFVQVAEELGGNEFYQGDVEGFLAERGVL